MRMATNITGGVRTFVLRAARIVAILLAGLSFTEVAISGPVAEVQPGTRALDLNRHVEYLEDKAGRWSIDEVQQPPLSDRFRQNKRRVFNAGFTPSAYWYRLVLRDARGESAGGDRWYLQVGFAPLDYVDIYLPGDAGGWQVYELGDQRPFGNRPLKHRNFVVPVDFRDDQPVTAYLRVQTKSAHVVPIGFASSSSLHKTEQDEMLVLGGYYGIMVVLILYNFFGWLAVRDRSYLDYIFFVLFGGMLLSLSLNGLGLEYLWTDRARWANASIPFHISAALFFLLAFTQSFLQTRRQFPGMHRMLLALQLACVAGAMLAFVLDYADIIRATLVGTVVVAAAVLFTSTSALVHGLRAARLYLLALAVYAAFILLQIAQVSDLLPAHVITTYFFQIGTAAATLLLSLALADRVNLERREKESLIQERQRAELSTQAKSEFLARMSHEIRTPMNAIIGFTDLAMRADKEAKRLGFLANIRAASQTLLTILNDILDLSKIEAGKLELERQEFRLRSVLEKLGVLFSQVAAEKNIELTLSIPAQLPAGVIGDPVRLEQILVNLTSNALKFTEHGEVEISVTEEQATRNRSVLRFSIRDTGIGLSTVQAARLFQPFSQADHSTTRRYGGTGLGLSISKQLVERMGGSISVTSSLGSGSTFSFTLPFDLPEDSTAWQEATVPDNLHGLRTLVVDDSATARKVHTVMLKSLGLVPEAVSSGDEAVRKFSATPYQLVIMDWDMPGMDGMESARLIRALPKGENVPIVMVTVHPRDELSRRLDPGLVNATLSKPVTASDLFDTLMRLYSDPSKPARVMPELSATPGAEKLRGATVLLVEDNLLNQRLAAEILKGLGINVDIANDGAEGLAAVQKKPYDAVLMDMQMPVMDGVEATHRIRERKEFEHLPIIAITANVLPRDTDACLDAGMNDFIPKPINPAQMIRVLGRWIGTPPGAEAPRVAQPTAAPAQVVTESTPPINITAGLARLDGNRKLFGELLEIFRGHHAGDREKFQAAMAAGDRKKAHHLIHTLKGVAGNLAMPRLWSASAAMQQAIEGSGEVPDKVKRDFDAAFDAAIAAVDAAIREVNAGAKQTARAVKSGMH